jgi:hypothetical protein
MLMTRKSHDLPTRRCSGRASARLSFNVIVAKLLQKKLIILVGNLVGTLTLLNGF